MSQKRHDGHFDKLIESITEEQFKQWYREREYRQNIENGTPYFNKPGSAPDPERHSPSKLCQCHRKIFYREHNAPAENPEPSGIFWFGSKFEEEIVFPFLERGVTDQDTYVQNSIWVDFNTRKQDTNLRIKGMTDPVIVDADAVPILPLEIKTKSSIEHVSAPNRHHLAQTHCYMAGLSEKFDTDIDDAVILYGSRDSLDIKVFHVNFDQEFWENSVLSWAAKHTVYRIDDDLPPADPAFDWECGFCDYKERCGKGESTYNDCGVDGFVPRFTGYPRDNVVKYLEANPDARLTPTLADEFPELAEEHGVYPWICPECSEEYDWQKFADQGSGEALCPNCANEGSLVHVQCPPPSEQDEARIIGDKNSASATGEQGG